MSLSSDDMVLYAENPKSTTRKLLEFINEVGKVEGYTINTQKYVAFPYMNNKISAREVKQTILFTAHQKW